jgi:hypothetical protein
LQRMRTACRVAAEKQVQHLERRIKDPFQRALREGGQKCPAWLPRWPAKSRNPAMLRALSRRPRVLFGRTSARMNTQVGADFRDPAKKVAPNRQQPSEWHCQHGRHHSDREPTSTRPDNMDATVRTSITSRAISIRFTINPFQIRRAHATRNLHVTRISPG